MNKRPRVWFEISIDGTFEGRINISLYNDITPITAENFRCLCTGEKGVGQSGKNLHYKGNYIHKAITEFVLQGGDITTQDGKGGESIYGPRFKDENFKIKHDMQAYYQWQTEVQIQIALNFLLHLLIVIG